MFLLNESIYNMSTVSTSTNKDFKALKPYLHTSQLLFDKYTFRNEFYFIFKEITSRYDPCFLQTLVAKLFRDNHLLISDEFIRIILNQLLFNEECFQLDDYAHVPDYLNPDSSRLLDMSVAELSSLAKINQTNHTTHTNQENK